MKRMTVVLFTTLVLWSFAVAENNSQTDAGKNLSSQNILFRLDIVMATNHLHGNSLPSFMKLNIRQLRDQLNHKHLYYISAIYLRCGGANSSYEVHGQVELPVIPQGTSSVSKLPFRLEISGVSFLTPANVQVGHLKFFSNKPEFDYPQIRTQFTAKNNESSFVGTIPVGENALVFFITPTVVQP
jgi:hypothetical protein